MNQSSEKLVGSKVVSEVEETSAQVLDQAGVVSAKKIKAAGSSTTKVQAGAASATEIEVSVPLVLVVDQVGSDFLPADFHDPEGHKER
jgi:hypothetical protein